MSAQAKISVVGSLHFDIMLRTPHLPRLGETLIGSDWWWKPGGKGGNQAMAAARHGSAVDMIGALGSDDFGAKMRLCLADAGVRHDLVLDAGRRSGMSVALVEAAGDYSAVVVSGANLAIDVAQIAASASVLRQARILILQNEIGEAANIAAARMVKEAGGTVLLNAAPFRPLPQELASCIDVLIVNAIEAEMLGAGHVHDLDSAKAAARQLAEKAPAIVVTAGGHGVAWCEAGQDGTLPAYAVQRPQTHGAGDVFVGALAARLAEGQALENAIAYANGAAALHVGAAEPDRAAIDQAAVIRFLASPSAS